MISQEDEDEKLVKSAYGVLLRFLKNFPQGYELSIAQVDRMVLGALKQHGDHLSVHGIKQTSIDAFKVTCWLGCCCLDALEKEDNHQFDVVATAMIKTLRELMVLETDWNLVPPKSAVTLLKSCLQEEWRDNGDHGIWKNGLYMSFHVAVKSWREGQACKVAL